MSVARINTIMSPRTCTSIFFKQVGKTFFSETVIYFHLLELLGAEVGEDVALGGGEDLEGDGAVVVLQGGHVVVPG